MKLLHLCERIIILVLLAMMMLAVLLSTVDLGVVLFQELLKPPRFLLNVAKLLEIFGFFMMVLIGLELLETIKSYLELNRVHIEVVLLVAMVAVARKVIIVDYKEYSGTVLLGIAALLVSLAISFYLIRKAPKSAGYLYKPTDKQG